jgi:signal transduction histidine kinase
VIENALRAVWTEPPATRPPGPGRRDWVLVAAFACAAVLEGLLRPDVVWRPVVVLQTVALAFTLPWRRRNPLAVVAVAFGCGIAADLAALALDVRGSMGLYSMLFLLLLPYALFRWGSGRAVVVGSAVILAALGLGLAKESTRIEDVVGGFVVLTLPALLGLSVRFWTTSRLRELEQVRLRERELLARELHDTVAHHVSAMVIRAQAGRVVAGSRPAAAVEALEIIEVEGSRTLTEMRTMVGALRDGDDADLAPLGGLADIERLARSAGDPPSIRVSITDVPDDVSPSVEAALYRIAREAVTNARRHAHRAGQIVIQVTGLDDRVRLTVSDDGDPVPATKDPATTVPEGYGIVGMTERAQLLGGTLAAGPGRDRGWVVEAVLPRAGEAA